MMIKLSSEEVLYIAGRGTVAVIDLRKQTEYVFDPKKGLGIRVDDVIELDGEEVLVRGIETFRDLFDDPKPNIGILFRKLSKEEVT